MSSAETERSDRKAIACLFVWLSGKFASVSAAALELRGASWGELKSILQPSPPSQWANSLISFLTASLGSLPSLCSPQDFSPQTLSPTGWLRSNRQCHSLWSFSLSLWSPHCSIHSQFSYFYLQQAKAKTPLPKKPQNIALFLLHVIFMLLSPYHDWYSVWLTSM